MAATDGPVDGWVHGSMYIHFAFHTLWSSHSKWTRAPAETCGGKCSNKNKKKVKNIEKVAFGCYKVTFMTVCPALHWSIQSNMCYFPATSCVRRWFPFVRRKSSLKRLQRSAATPPPSALLVCILSSLENSLCAFSQIDKIYYVCPFCQSWMLLTRCHEMRDTRTPTTATAKNTHVGLCTVT